MHSPHNDENSGIQDEVSLSREEEEESFVQQGPHLLTGHGSRSATAAAGSGNTNTNASNAELAVHPSNSKDDAPIPPAQVAAVYEEMEEGLKVDDNEAKLPEYMYDNEAPMPNQYDNGREGKKIRAAENKKLEVIDDGDAPLVAGQVADIVPDDEEDDIVRKKAAMIPVLQANSPSTQPEHEVAHPDSNASDPQSGGSGTGGANTGQSPAVVTRPPPRSMLPRPSTDRDTDAETPILEATLVREQPVYDATRVSSIHDMPIPWWKKYRRCLFVGVGLLVGLAAAVAVGVSTRSNDNSSNANKASESATILPDNMIPSSYPSLEPSQSSIPTPLSSPPPSLSLVPTKSSQPTHTMLYLIQQPLPGGADDDLRCIDLRGDDAVQKTTVWYYPCNSNPGQYWYRDSTLDYIRSSVDTNKCLVGVAASIEKGTKMYIWDCPDDDYRFKWDVYGDGSIRPRNNELLCLQPSTEGEGKGFYLILDDCREDYKTFKWIANEDTQRPSFQPTASSVPSFMPSKSLQPSKSPVPTSYWSTLKNKQLGDSIMGGKDGDRFGYSLSFSPDSSLLAIGAYQDGNNGRGYVNVYRVDEFTSAFTKLGVTLLGDKDGDWFGLSLSFFPDSSLLAVGDVHANGDGPGYVNVYRFDEPTSSFIQFGDSLVGGKDGDNFGWSISFFSTSNLLAVGAVQYGNAGPGYVNIYRIDGVTFTLTHIGNTLVGGKDDDRFGSSLSFSPDSNLLAVGAHQQGNDGPGYVNIYGVDEAASTFTQFGDSIVGGKDGDGFGYSLSFSPDSSLLAIGAFQLYGADPGYVNVYRVDYPTSFLIQLGNALSGGKAGDKFGSSVSFSPHSNLLAIGASQDGNDGPGYVNVYRFDEPSSSFIQLGDSLVGGEDGDRFGKSLSFSATSNLLAVGAEQYENDGPGYVTINQLKATASSVPSFVPSKSLQPSTSPVPTSYLSTLKYKQLGDSIMDGKDGDRFGYSLSFSPDSSLLAIGAFQLYGADPGYVNVYRVDYPTSFLIQLGNALSGGKAGDKFGSSVSFSPHSNLLAIGASQDGNDGPGYVTIYQLG